MGLVRPMELSLGWVSVADFGATGNGTDDTVAIQNAIDYCFGSTEKPNGSARAHDNKVLIFPPGNFRTTAPLTFNKLQGSRILGAGRFITTISNPSGSPVVVTNGAGYCHFEGLHLRGASGATLFDLDYDGGPGGAALQSNTFQDIEFEGGSIGINIGRTGFMGSENLFLNCYFISCSTAGLVCSNFNALQQTVIGGNFQNCGVGIWASVGSVNSIIGVGFQQSKSFDIQADQAVHNTINVMGCRTESPQFFKSVTVATITGCHQTSAAAPGIFAQTDGNLSVISACEADGIVIPRYGSRMKVQNCRFDSASWMAPEQLWSEGNGHANNKAQIEIENVVGGGVETVRQRITGDANGDPIIQNYAEQWK